MANGINVTPNAGNGSKIVTVVIPLLATPVHVKPFPNISKIEIFSRKNFKRWQEIIFFVQDMHGVAYRA